MVATPIDDMDVCNVIGMADRLVVSELVRTGASRDELAAAFAFVSGSTAMSTAAYRALGLRMQRLVDLLSVRSPEPRTSMRSSFGVCEAMAATGSIHSAPSEANAIVAAGKHEVRRTCPPVRADDATTNAALLIWMLAKRIGPDRSLQEAEAWWPLALRIGAAIEADVQATEEDKQAARAVVWAVSDAIRACKRSGRCDHHLCRAALAKLARTIRWKGVPAELPLHLREDPASRLPTGALGQSTMFDGEHAGEIAARCLDAESRQFQPFVE